jgi:hypothetical protein
VRETRSSGLHTRLLGTLLHGRRTGVPEATARRLTGPALVAARTAVWHHLLAPAVASGDDHVGRRAVDRSREAVALLERIGWPGDRLPPSVVVGERHARRLRLVGIACLECGESLARDLAEAGPWDAHRGQARQAREEMERGRLILEALDPSAGRAPRVAASETVIRSPRGRPRCPGT